MNRVEWMKGICHIWSKGRHFSPSMPGDRYLKLSSQKRSPAEISGNIVWYDALALRPEVLLDWYFVCSCAVMLELNFLTALQESEVLRKTEYFLGKQC